LLINDDRTLPESQFFDVHIHKISRRDADPSGPLLLPARERSPGARRKPLWLVESVAAFGKVSGRAEETSGETRS
jgi:hypothetical protein